MACTTCTTHKWWFGGWFIPNSISPPIFRQSTRVPHLFGKVDGLVEHVAPNPHQPRGQRFHGSTCSWKWGKTWKRWRSRAFRFVPSPALFEENPSSTCKWKLSPFWACPTNLFREVRAPVLLINIHPPKQHGKWDAIRIPQCLQNAAVISMTTFPHRVLKFSKGQIHVQILVVFASHVRWSAQHIFQKGNGHLKTSLEPLTGGFERQCYS